jgi:hypothetical protein
MSAHRILGPGAERRRPAWSVAWATAFIPTTALALVILERAFDHIGLFECRVLVQRHDGAGFELEQSRGHACGPGQFVWRPAGNQHEAVAPNGAVLLGFARPGNAQILFSENPIGASSAV